MRLRRALLQLALLAALAACGRTAPGFPPASLEGTEWELITLNGEALLPGTHITLTIEDGGIGGFAGCNWYHTAEIPDSDERPLVVTLIGCEEPAGILEQEQTYLEALQQAKSYEVSDGRLELSAPGGQTLAFSQRRVMDLDPAALVGTSWRLLTQAGADPLPGTDVTLSLGEGTFSGAAGCRGYRGSYTAEGDRIRFGYLEMVGQGCLHPDSVVVHEGVYTDALQTSTHYRLSEGELEITSDRGGPLLFEPLPAGATASPLTTTWVLTGFVERGTTTPALADAEVTLVATGGLQGNGSLTGSAGCNTYSAEYGFDGSFLSITSVGATKRACTTPAGVMQQEQRFLALLQGVTAFQITGNELRLTASGGAELLLAAE
ncbi:MAG: META domain-containing protein [Anaerolineae bacterium]